MVSRAVETAPAPAETVTDATEGIPRPPVPAEAAAAVAADVAEVAPPPVPSVSADDPASRARRDPGRRDRRRRPARLRHRRVRSTPTPPAPAPSETAEDDDEDEVEDEDEFHDAEITLPPPAPGELLGDVIGVGGAGSADDGRGPLVDAKLCPDGHANPPVVASCAVCGQFLTPGTATVVHVPRPSLGHLELDDGTIVELDHELLIGRNPDRDTHPERAGLRRVKVIGDKVSRSHLEIRYQGWDVLVADCGSTNGTFVVPHPGGQVTAPRGRSGAVARARGDGVLRIALVHRRRQGGRMKHDLRLRVEYCGEVRAVETSDELTFGRAGDLRIDDNRHLHRVLGRLWARGEQWWLTQRGQLDLDPDRRRRLALQRRARAGQRDRAVVPQLDRALPRRHHRLRAHPERAGPGGRGGGRRGRASSGTMSSPTPSPSATSSSPTSSGCCSSPSPNPRCATPT